MADGSMDKSQGFMHYDREFKVRMFDEESNLIYMRKMVPKNSLQE